MSLGDLGDQLRQLRAITESQRNSFADPIGVAKARESIREALRVFDPTAYISGEGPIRDGYAIEGVSEAVAQFRVRGVDLAPGERLDIEVEVTESAQTGALYLSLGGPTLDFNVNSALTLRITGALGREPITINSGQTIGQIANAINSVSDSTGVTATAGPSGVSLRAMEFASGVSVAWDSAGGIASGTTLGVYQFQDENNYEVDAASHTEFTAGRYVIDYGQDVGFTVNGREAVTDGLRGAVQLDGGLEVMLDLRAYFEGTKEPAPAIGINFGHPFNAFTIVGTGHGGAHLETPESDRLDVRI